MARLLVVLAIVACGPKPAQVRVVAPPPKHDAPPPPTAEAKAAAETIAHLYQILTVESAVPADPKRVRQAALEALGALPAITWTEDPTRDADTLRAAVEKLALPADAVLRAARAMTLAADDTETFAMSKASLTALFATIGGGPVVQPGMLYLKLDDGRWAVSELVAGGPAQAAGVMRGDVLVTIDGARVVHGWMDFAPLLGAPEATEAKLVVERGGTEREIVLKLAPIALQIVESRMLAGGIGYIRIWACTRSDDPARDAAKLVAVALAELDKKKAKKLVLDLRGNAGGFPFDIASLLVAADPLMVAVGSDGAEQPVARTAVVAWKTRRPIAVIVDDLTASGAEMIAFALREHAGAKLVGRPTAGALTFPTTEKLSGDVSISYPLSRVGSAKTKEVLDKNRLEPDVADGNRSADDYAANRDPQLDAAVAALKAAH